MTVTAFLVIILKLAVGLGMGVTWLINIHALSYQSKTKCETNLGNHLRNKL